MCIYRIVKVLLGELITRSLQSKSAKVMLRRYITVFIVLNYSLLILSVCHAIIVYAEGFVTNQPFR